MISRVRFAALTLLLSMGSAPLALPQTPPAAPATFPAAALTQAGRLDRTHAAAAALLTLYNHDTGLFNTTGWWNSANAVTALTDQARLTHDKTLRPILANTFTRAPNGTSTPAPNFLNKYYDDEGWWALAWIDAFDLTHRKPYLRTAQTIFDNMAGGWDSTCGGGIWWSKDRTYKNAIANELFLSVAAHLAQHARGKSRARYLDWANREWTWFAHTGMINTEDLVNDGLTIDPATGSCRNNGKTTWTYNQGVLLGGLAALNQADPQPGLLPSAHRTATAAITHLTDSGGILHDPCEPDCGGDGVQFKGIFTRNLAELQHAQSDPAFVRFLTTDADTLWSSARTPGNRFSTVWSGPPRADDAGAQASALDLLNAAARVTP